MPHKNNKSVDDERRRKIETSWGTGDNLAPLAAKNVKNGYRASRSKSTMDVMAKFEEYCNSTSSKYGLQSLTERLWTFVWSNPLVRRTLDNEGSTKIKTHKFVQSMFFPLLEEAHFILQKQNDVMTSSPPCLVPEQESMVSLVDDGLVVLLREIDLLGMNLERLQDPESLFDSSDYRSPAEFKYYDPFATGLGIYIHQEDRMQHLDDETYLWLTQLWKDQDKNIKSKSDTDGSKSHDDGYLSASDGLDCTDSTFSAAHASSC